jgi:hypothetical protein
MFFLLDPTESTSTVEVLRKELDFMPMETECSTIDSKDTESLPSLQIFQSSADDDTSTYETTSRISDKVLNNSTASTAADTQGIGKYKIRRCMAELLSKY